MNSKNGEMKRICSLLLVLVLLGTSHIIKAQDVKTGIDVLTLMYEKYEGKWYKQFTFTQETIFYGQNEEVVRTQTWYEAMDLPGRLAIKFDDKASGNGILFRNGMQYGYANGVQIQKMSRVHDLLALGFDVYHQSVDSTANQLARNGYDLQKVYQDEWQGRSVYVVGVDSPSNNTQQFWIDAERLVFVRNITIGRGNTLQEVQFNNYEKLGEGWVAPEVVFKANGQLGLLEKYSDMSIPKQLNPDIFDPEKFTTAEW